MFAHLFGYVGLWLAERVYIGPLCWIQVGPCWVHVGATWSSVGLMFAQNWYFGGMLGLNGSMFAHLEVLLAHLGSMLGPSSPI